MFYRQDAETPGSAKTFRSLVPLRLGGKILDKGFLLTQTVKTPQSPDDIG